MQGSASPLPVLQRASLAARPWPAAASSTALCSTQAGDDEKRNSRNPFKQLAALVVLVVGTLRNKLFRVKPIGAIRAKILELPPLQKRRLRLLVSLFLFSALSSSTLRIIRYNMGMGPGTEVATEVAYSAFLEMLNNPEVAGKVTDMTVATGGKFEWMLEGKKFFSVTVPVAEQMVQRLQDAGVPFRASVVPTASRILTRMLTGALQIAYIAFWVILFRRNMGGGNNPAKKLGQKLPPGLSFDDVAGVDEAKQEVSEVVDMLKRPDHYANLGARIPRGVLLVGPPGTGKTLLARCMAAEAGVPFFYCSGSDFVEMFVGRGAARIRALFEKARKAAPCILFIDEVDALGKQRSGGMIRGNDEAEQTLNQLLASMDGLDRSGVGITVLGATNRYDILDEALTRPGRFDRIVTVPVPDKNGRLAILRVHTKKLSLDDTCNLEKVAIAARGLSGAELESVCNEAAIRAVRRNSQAISQTDFDEATQYFFKTRMRGPINLRF